MNTEISTLALGLLDRPLSDVPQALVSGQSNGNAVAAGTAILSWMDLIGTGTGRATAYNTREEQDAAEALVHDRAFMVDRRIYGALAAMPGALDRAKSQALLRLLSSPIDSSVTNVVNPDEWMVISKLISQLPPQRMFKLFDELRKRRVNNKRTRKVILGAIIGSTKLHWWSVKYRGKIKSALKHALGSREFGVICSSAATWLDNLAAEQVPPSDPRERAFVQFISAMHPVDTGIFLDTGIDKPVRLAEALAFIAGRKLEHHTWRSGLFLAFYEARLDLAKGTVLPPEVLEGIRGHYHPTVSKDDVIALTSRTNAKGKGGSMTQRQRGAVQKRAKSAGIEVEFDPMKLGLVQLWVHAFEVGLDERVAAAIARKAHTAASVLGMSYEHVAIVVDCSESMAGSDEQKLRPMSIALSMRDTLMATCTESAKTFYCGGEPDAEADSFPVELVRPAGDTSIASAVIKALRYDSDLAPGATPDVLFIVSDGYENAPAGRVAEVLAAVRRMGIDTPVFQFNPVMAGEKGGVRPLAPGIATTMPVSDPTALGLSLVRGLLESDPAQGLALVAQKAAALLGD